MARNVRTRALSSPKALGMRLCFIDNQQVPRKVRLLEFGAIRGAAGREEFFPNVVLAEVMIGRDHTGKHPPWVGVQAEALVKCVRFGAIN
jgi:hypothetical protein